MNKYEFMSKHPELTFLLAIVAGVTIFKTVTNVVYCKTVTKICELDSEEEDPAEETMETE